MGGATIMKKAIPWLVLIVLLVAAGAWYLLSWPPADSHPSVIPLPEPAVTAAAPDEAVPAAATEPPAEPAPAAEPLPPLAESDPLVTELLTEMIGPEPMDTYVVPGQLISRIVATIDSLSSREIAPLVMPLRPVSGKFAVLDGGAMLTINPLNDARYSPYVRMLQSVDTATLVDTYRRFYPLFQEAYVALGYPDGDFNDRLIEVLGHLLETPEVQGPVRLVKPEAVYLYEDEALESLSAGQKILLRIGPENAAIVRARLAAILAAISAPLPE
jgi:hypothetical protein